MPAEPPSPSAPESPARDASAAVPPPASAPASPTSGAQAADVELDRAPAEFASSPRKGPVLKRTGSKARRTVAISGAKGGAGKTVVACNLAIYMSTLGRTTLVVDADRSGAHLHTLLGVPPRLPAQGRAPAAARPLEIEATDVPGLFFMQGGVADGHAGQTPSRTRRELFEALATIDCDYLVLDLGAGIDAELLDLYLAADVALYVTIPEPPAVEGTYRFVRALFLRALAQRAGTPGERAQLFALADELGGLPVPRELAEALAADEHPLAETALGLLTSHEVHFVVNQSRVRTDLELGESIRSAAWQRLGVSLHYLGYIDYDDNVWACVREQTPLLVKAPGTKASKSLEKLARRLLALDTAKGAARALRTVPKGSHHDLLEIDRGATDEEIRRANRRMRDVYGDEALCCYGLYTQAELKAVRARLDEAFDVLLDPARRRPYELTVFPDAESAAPEEVPDEARTRELPPAPAISTETEFDGSLLRAVRESQGLELKQIARRTRISLAYLEAIESDDFGALPALVYVRGFVAELAKSLRLDPVQVAHTYVRRVKRSEAGERA
ncbi:MAG: Flagellar synthesis regulator FleN [Myxococcaceae bacterium]|nr:Flagellar synthesis regulator FleN [Myxococcaceae bacterium]